MDQAHQGGTDGFVVKLDASGTVLWTRMFGTPATDVATSVVTDAAGDVFVAGTTAGSMPGESLAGGTDAFVVAYDTTGVLQWIRQRGSSDDDAGVGIARFDSALYLGGTTDGTVDDNKSVGGKDLFDVKLELDGRTR